jgi:hypothetical protein
MVWSVWLLPFALLLFAIPLPAQAACPLPPTAPHARSIACQVYDDTSNVGPWASDLARCIDQHPLAPFSCNFIPPLGPYDLTYITADGWLACLNSRPLHEWATFCT